MDNNSCARYYQKNKEKLQNKCVAGIKMVVSGHENLPKHEKQKLVEYRKEYYEICKSFMQ